MWYVTRVIIDHNHDLSLEKERYFKCNRNLNSSVRRKIKINDIFGIGLSQSYNSCVVEARGFENLPFIEKDCRNLINKKYTLSLAKEVLKHLQTI